MLNENESFLLLWEQAKKQETEQNHESYELSDFLKAPDRTDAFFAQFLLRDVGRFRANYYSAIAQNPNVSQEIINALAAKAGGRSEYRAIKNYYEKQAEKLGLAVKRNEYPREILDGRSLDDNLRIHLVFGALGYMAEDLWHDLGSGKIWELGYQEDEADGDFFGPARLNSSGTEYLLSPGYFCKWIEKKPEIIIDWLVDISEESWEDHIESQGSLLWARNFPSDYSKAAVFLSGIASGDIVNYNEEAAQRLLFDQYSDNQDYTIIGFDYLEFPFTGLRYQDLNPEAQVSLVNNLVFAHDNDIFIKTMNLARHIINLIATHPKTCGEAIKIIGSHADPFVSETSMKYREMASNGELI